MEEESEEEEDPDDLTLTELGFHMLTITEILADLYKLSFRIQNTATRSRPMKPTLYKEVDKETSIDKFTLYANFRKDPAEKMSKDVFEVGNIQQEDNYLIERLAIMITNRRKVLCY